MSYADGRVAPKVQCPHCGSRIAQPAQKHINKCATMPEKYREFYRVRRGWPNAYWRAKIEDGSYVL